MNENLSPRQKILVVDTTNGQIGLLLKAYLKKFDNDVYMTPQLPSNISQFSFCFIVGDVRFLKKLKQFDVWNHVIFLFIGKHQKVTEALSYLRGHHLERIKIVSCPQGDVLNQNQIQEIVWFGISKSKETLYTLSQIVIPEKTLARIPRKMPHFPIIENVYIFLEKILSVKHVTILAFFCIFLYHVAFIGPLLGGGFYIVKAINEAQKSNYKKTIQLLQSSNPYILSAKTLYTLVRPSYLLFSIAQIPDDIFAIHDKTMQLLSSSNTLQSNTRQIFSLLLKKNKSSQEIIDTKNLIRNTQTLLAQIESHLLFIHQKIPNIQATKPLKEKISLALNMLAKAKKISPFLSTLFAQNGEKKYLLLFANNMELRPGGGFIGSYGVLTMNNLTLTDLAVYDVYDADGQLTAHIDPPTAIRDYLHQPHWFLRDSAFSPDFYDNYFQAKKFLDKEKQMIDFSGGILITTTAIKNILYAFGDVYIPDFNEKINADNFYLKTQLFAEKDFFPGSTQKKSFLSALTRQIFINLETISTQTFLNQIFKSLEEKQLVMYIENTDLQKIIDSYYWAGRIIEPHCPPNITNCYSDFLFPYDANLGVNKANFFLNRNMQIQVTIDHDGFIHSKLTAQFKNESIQDIFPGGVYRNYFQVLIPRESIIKNILVGDMSIQNYDQEVGQFKQVGFFFETPLQSTQEIVIQYQSLKSFQKGKSIYQLLFQKQIGSINNDLRLEISLPSNMFLINQNFSPLVKNNQILYNTELSADKIFFVELLKD